MKTKQLYTYSATLIHNYLCRMVMNISKQHLGSLEEAVFVTADQQRESGSSICSTVLCSIMIISHLIHNLKHQCEVASSRDFLFPVCLVQTISHTQRGTTVGIIHICSKYSFSIINYYQYFLISNMSSHWLDWLDWLE